MKDRFLFFENFYRIAESLPEDLQLKFYKSLMGYVFDGVIPDDAIMKSLIIALQPSLDKEEKRGGNHNPLGQNQHSKSIQKNTEVKVGQNNNNLGQKEVKVGQSGQSFLETETRNKKQETEITNNSSNKFSELLVCAQKFIPPTVEEVSAYCKERNNGVVAERFVDFYACKGWMVGKNKMKDWRAAVRNWEKSTEKPKEHEIGDWL